MPEAFDVCVCGAGTAGMPVALFAAQRGARVLLVESTDTIGGTTNVSGGTLAAGGTRRQAERAIEDSPDAHFHDVMRLGHGCGNAEMIRLTTELAPAMVDWLVDNGLELEPETPAIIYRHECYRVARTVWGVGKGRSLTAVFEPRLRTDPNVTIAFGTRFTDLVVDGQGRVTGARLSGPGGVERTIACPNVVLATGGYSSNPGLFSEFTEGRPLVSGANVWNTGRGIEVARQLGAAMHGGRSFLPKFGGVEDPPGSGRIQPKDFPLLTVQSRPPWEVYVNQDGERFVAEDTPSMDVRERSLLAQPDMVFWIVFDARMFGDAPTVMPGWTAERWEAAFRSHPSFVRADSLRELAGLMGVPADTFLATVEDFNRGVATGEDRLGRRNLPLPLAEAPFMAVKNHGTCYTSCAGLVTDLEMRVLRTDGAPIEGLFAVGEILGRELISGDAFVGGMSITPALCFGRLLGERILSWEERR